MSVNIQKKKIDKHQKWIIKVNKKIIISLDFQNVENCFLKFCYTVIKKINKYQLNKNRTRTKISWNYEWDTKIFNVHSCLLS